MKKMTIRQGAQLNFEVTGVDADAVSVIFLAKKNTETITDTVTPVAGVASFSIPIDAAQVLGEYQYQISVTFADVNPTIYPNDGCTGNCEDGQCALPILVVCEALEA